MLTRGDICLIPYPFSDKAAAKLRPTLLLQGFGPLFLALTDGRHSPAGLQAVFLPLTSKIQPGPFTVVIREDHASFFSTGLKVASTILCWNIHTIPKCFIERTIGHLDATLMAEVEDKLRQVLGL